MAKNPEWECVEPGWWVRSNVGGVCKEADGAWYGHPINHTGPPIGPCRTKQEAINKLESM